MRIAVMADSTGQDARVPDEYESSPAMLVVETDDGSVVAAVEGPDTEKYLSIMVEQDCEAVVLGPHIGQKAFEPIAGACITRFQGDGLPVMEAARRALYNDLEIIADFEGGPGCDSGTHSCADHEH
jgi:predicted Fe-Mo cluster-binding NifX family protein